MFESVTKHNGADIKDVGVALSSRKARLVPGTHSAGNFFRY